MFSDTINRNILIKKFKTQYCACKNLAIIMHYLQRRLLDAALLNANLPLIYLIRILYQLFSDRLLDLSLCTYILYHSNHQVLPCHMISNTRYLPISSSTFGLYFYIYLRYLLLRLLH